MSDSVLDSDNPLYKETEPVLLDILCRGFIEAPRSKLISMALVSLAMSPIAWLAILFKKAIHFIIIGAIWFIFQDQLSEHEPLSTIVLVLALVVLLYKDIYQEVLDLLTHLLQMLSGGGFLVWVSRGAIESAPVRQKLIKSKQIQTLAAASQGAIAPELQARYNHFMNLYLDQGQIGNASTLQNDIVSYWASPPNK